MRITVDCLPMYLVAIGWMFVVVCMAAVEGTTSIWGALGTLVFYGVLPLGLFVWLVGTPQRRRDRQRSDATRGASFDRRPPGDRDETRDETRAEDRDDRPPSA